MNILIQLIQSMVQVFYPISELFLEHFKLGVVLLELLRMIAAGHFHLELSFVELVELRVVFAELGEGVSDSVDLCFEAL